MKFSQHYQARPGQKIHLDKIASLDGRLKDLKLDDQHIATTSEQLNQLQWQLYSENRQSLLIVFQALDAGGKDGTLRHVLSPMNPQGLRIESFKQPSSEEAAHDFLWRVHARAPKRGEIVVFNRSHYEDVLVARVHQLVGKSVWKNRYKHINAFEQLLAEQNQTRIIKFYLHMSREEQLKRFHERLDNPHKNWKISEADYREREYWDDYMQAFEQTIERTSNDYAPWFIVPADDKAARNQIVAEIIRETLEDMDPRYPELTADLNSIRAKYYAAKAEMKGKNKKDKKSKND